MKLNSIYAWLRHPGESLSQKVVHSGFWVFLLRITNRLFVLGRTIVLARLLAPNDFGLYGISLLSLSALETFSQTGFDQAIIQKKEDTKSYLDTAWTIQVIRGFVLAIILLLGAPLVGTFFGEPRAVLIVRVLGVAVLLKGLRNIGIVYFQKELEFHKQFFYEFGGTFADLAVAIPAAFIFRSVWALVFGLLAGNLVRMVVSYFVHPYRPHLSFNQEKFKELFVFGKWVLGSSVIIFLITQGDDALVGKILGTTALGFYQIAYRISNLPSTEITHVISQVTFPAYSKLQSNLTKLKEAYLRSLQLTTLISLPIAGMIFATAPEFTCIFLGEKWMPMVPAMQMLSLFGAIRSINATFGPLYHSVGRPFLLMKVSLIQLCLLALIIYPLSIEGGIFGTSVAVTVANFLCIMLSTYEALKILNGSVKILLLRLAAPILLTSGIIGSIYLIKLLMVERTSTFVVFVISIFAGLSIYLYWIKISGFSIRNLSKSGELFKSKTTES